MSVDASDGGGWQQRLGLASILVMQQPVLVIDEPTSRLDPECTDMMFELVAAAHVDQPAFVRVADHFGGTEIGLGMNRLVDLLRPPRPDETDDHSDHEEP